MTKYTRKEIEDIINSIRSDVLNNMMCGLKEDNPINIKTCRKMMEIIRQLLVENEKQQEAIEEAYDILKDDPYEDPLRDHYSSVQVALTELKPFIGGEDD